MNHAVAIKRLILVNLVVALVCAISGQLVRLLAIPPGTNPTIWPPIGIALGSMLLWGYGVWPGFVVGNAIGGIGWAPSGISAAAYSPVAIIITLVGSLGVILAVWLIKRKMPPDAIFCRVHHVVLFFVIIVGSSLISPTQGMLFYKLFGIATWETFWHDWWTWWLSVLFGMVFVSPLVLTWRIWCLTGRRRHPLEAAAFMTAVLGAAWLVFTPSGVYMPSLNFVIIPLFLWGALRLHSFIIAVGLLAVTSLAAWGTLHGLGPFVTENPVTAVYMLEAYMAVLALTVYVLNVSILEREHAQYRLEQLAGELESRVEERTQRLHEALASLQQAHRALQMKSKAYEDTAEVLRRTNALLLRAEGMAQLGYWTGTSEQLENSPGLFKIIGKPWVATVPLESYEWVHPEDRARVKERVEQVMRTGGNASDDYRIVRADGEIRYIHEEFTVEHEAGKPVRQFGVVQDITERKQAENDLRVSEEALRRERSFLSTSIDTLPLPVAYVSPKEEIVRMNRASAEILHSANPQDWWNVQLALPNTDIPLPIAQWPALRALHGERIVNYEAIIRFPDGRDVPVLFNAAPIYTDHDPAASIVVFQDITKLKEADRTKDQFLMILSHELKTPLTSIRGWAQAAEKMTDVVPQALPIIIRNVDKQMKILEDLLLVSRIVTGRFTVTPAPTDLREMAHAAVENSRQVAHDRCLRLIEDTSVNPLPLSADAGRINQAIDNLLYNAIKFTEAGGTIWVRTFRVDNDAVIQVQDTGRGIPPEQLAYLFRPFMQIEREERKGGLGLGLSLVKGIVEAHGGQVVAASPGIGQGSTFTISLPLAIR